MASNQLSQEEYDEPVFFCSNCHSLNILIDDNFISEDWDGTYCGACHSTNVIKGKFGEWLDEENRNKSRAMRDEADRKKRW